MDLQDLLDTLDAGERIEGGSPLHEVMHRTSQHALRVTAELNGSYHEPARVRELLAELTGTEIPETVTVFPPLSSDFGRNLHLGERVFINSGCRFQDQGGHHDRGRLPHRARRRDGDAEPRHGPCTSSGPPPRADRRRGPGVDRCEGDRAARRHDRGGRRGRCRGGGDEGRAGRGGRRRFSGAGGARGAAQLSGKRRPAGGVTAPARGSGAGEPLSRPGPSDLSKSTPEMKKRPVTRAFLGVIDGI
jgi:hypothetical protein